jgi:hypothetical protein
LLIGDILEIDMHLKRNRRIPYWFAFVTVRLYNTGSAESVKRQLQEKETTKIVYDEPHFIEIKSYIPIKNRIDRLHQDISIMCRDFSTKPIVDFTPLKIYNGTALAVPREIQGQPLPINDLKGKPPMEVCPVLNLHRFKPLPQIKNLSSVFHEKDEDFMLKEYSLIEKEIFGYPRLICS